METQLELPDQTPWVELGVDTTSVDRMTQTQQGIHRFLDRFGSTFLGMVFGGDGASVYGVMDRSEAVDAVARRAAAGEARTIGVLRRLALCYELISGKREEAFGLVWEAAGPGPGSKALDPDQPLSKAITGRTASLLSDRERHLLLCLEWVIRSPRRLWLYPLFDRAARVRYRAYTPRFKGANPDDPPHDFKNRIAQLSVEYATETLVGRFKASADTSGRGAVQGLVVQDVVAAQGEIFVFMHIPGGRRVVPVQGGTQVIWEKDWLILRFDGDGRLWTYGKEVGVRLAEALLSTHVSVVRYVPYRPGSEMQAVRDWCRHLLDGEFPRAKLERITVAFPAFEATLSGDVAAGLAALQGVQSKETLLGQIPTLSIRYESVSGETSRYTVWIKDGAKPGIANVSHRGSGAGLAERREFVRWAKGHGVLSGPH